MAKRTLRMTAYLTLLFLFTNTHSIFADKDHWNPNPMSMYHQYAFPVRKQEDIDARIDYQGWSYAGRGEFPWLVEIRGKETEKFEEQEDWSNGNLLTSKFVLTTCYTVVNVKKYEAGPYTKTDPLFRSGILLTFLAPKNPKFYKVLYSDDYTYKTVGNGYYTGTRQVKRFIPHPKCNQFDLDYQWGLVEVKRPIWPTPPWTSYMPVDFNVGAFALIKQDYTSTKADLTLAAHCVVGLWSRLVSAEFEVKEKSGTQKKLYSNTRMRNYKIRYAVVNVDPGDCWKPPVQSAFPEYVRVGETMEEWECMALNSNETMGAVCDHDRGAPIVCDGVVRAVVLVGATKAYCNLTNPLPFLVMDIKFAFPMFGEISNEEWTLAELKHYGRIEPSP